MGTIGTGSRGSGATIAGIPDWNPQRETTKAGVSVDSVSVEWTPAHADRRARRRGPGERVNAGLKNWRVQRKSRSSHSKRSSPRFRPS
jgi:hypothetical protein